MQFLYLFFLLIWTFSLVSYESSPSGNNNSRSIPSVEVKFDQPIKQPSHNWNVSSNVSVLTNSSYRNAAHYTVLAHASPRLQYYFTHVVSPLMHDATVHNHCCVLPGYTFSAGFRDCINQLAQFSSSDSLLTANLAQRLETYCTRIENIVFSGKDHSFCETLSHQNQVALLNVYADFLKEFYAQNAPTLFFEQSTHNSMMQGIMKHIDWQSYDGKNIKSTPKQLQQHHATSVNGNLGAVYKAFHEGNNIQAYTIGNERVKTLIPRLLIGEKVKVTSVFEQYPALRQKIEPAYLAAQAKIEQQRCMQQEYVQQGAAAIKAQFKDGINVKTLFSDRTQQRYNSAVYHVDNPAFFKKMHAVAAEQAACIKSCHLTPDQKGILFEGGHLQHTLLDETISVIDTAISGDLVDNMQNVVIDLANTSIESNKHGQIVVTTQALDTCWAIIEYAHNIAKCAYTDVLNNMHPIERGIYHGVVDSISGVVHAVLHPIETAKETAQSLATVGYCLGKLAYTVGVCDAACDVLESDPKRYEEMIAQFAIDPEALVALYEHVYEQARNTSAEDIARVGTKTIIDTMLLHEVTKIVSAFGKEQWAALIGCMRKGERSAEVALTAENIPAKCGEEIASIVQKMEDNSKIGSDLTKVQIISEINANKIWSNSSSFAELNK